MKFSSGHANVGQEGMFVTEIRAAAALLRSRGFAICKPNPNKKKPTYKGWSTRSFEPADFVEGDQLGILSGALSDGNRPGHSLVVVDLDTNEAVGQADAHLPATGMSEGRPGKPQSHRYYLVPNDTIPCWARSTAKQGARAAVEKTGHPGPFIKSFHHRETGKEVIRFLGTGGQVVCPPAMWTNEDGTHTERREWVGDEPGTPAVANFPDLWRCVCELASECGARIPDVMPGQTGQRPATPSSDVLRRAASKYLAECPPSIAGQNGHSALFWAARCVVYGFDLDPHTALQLLVDEFNLRCQPKWSDRELWHKVEDADRTPFDKPRGWLRNESSSGKHGKHHPGPGTGERASGGDPPTGEGAGCGTSTDPPNQVFADTDIANGRRFATDHAANVRYVADWEQWVVFDGRRWEVDRSETRVEALAKETVDRMALEAAALIGVIANEIARTSSDNQEELARLKERDKQARAALKHAKASADMRAIGRMLHAARSEPRLHIARGGEVFDTRPDLLNCPNGTVELRTGALRQHRRADFLTRLCPTRFDPAATRDVYLSFLARVFDSKPAVAKYVRELSGYVITGEVTDQTLHIFNGDGSNGKNVLVDTWKTVLGEGEYAHTAAAELLVGDGWERHPTEKTGLRGARLVICSETGEDGILDETKMKALTGGDTVTARFMRGDFFQFEPTHKLTLLTNNRPRVRGTDHGVWRRLRLVPFSARFWKEADKELDSDGEYPDKFKADPTLGERLRTIEAEAVLVDMVEHAVAFYQCGGTLHPPAEVTGATAEYRLDEDVIGQFIAARVREDRSGVGVKASELYKAFVAWWEEQGHSAKKVPSATRFGKAMKRKFEHSTPHGVVYHVRLLPTSASEGSEGREGCSG
ncbi:MAG: phage/plasmid primase, P4 family [Planctomycetia bacterium]|nr:phage/plasmid primase, P4 family [Planctomycetia bacterium]